MMRVSASHAPRHMGRASRRLTLRLFGFNSPYLLLRHIMLSFRDADAFRSHMMCFATQSFVQAYLATARSKEEHRLLRYGQKIYSETDEDGIIAEIFKRIGTESRRFVEIGAAEGLENNTVWLLVQGWSGTWIEGLRRYTAKIEEKFAPLIKNGRLTVLNEYVTAESAERLDQEGYFSGIDLFSLDIDGNDYHIISKIKNLDARMVVVEYNAKFPPPHEFVMKYNPNHKWDMTDYFGASLTSWNKLLQNKGYSLVGCNVTGTNAFFVRNDLTQGKFGELLTAGNYYEPARYWLAPGFVSGHPPNFGDGHVS
jgi:hypothetical protein